MAEHSEHTSSTHTGEHTSSPTALPPTPKTLADVMAMVQLPATSDGIAVLNTMQEANADKNPALYQALTDAINQLQAM